MDIKRLSILSGTALIALTVTASAGPMSVSSSQIITPPTQIEQARYYYRHHYRHYGWHHGRHYGWHRGWYPRGYDYAYGYGYPYYNGYGYGAGLAAAATAPLAAATAVTAPLMTGRSVAESGNYCATPAKTCLLYNPSWIGNGCSCKVKGGHARGTVE